MEAQKSKVALVTGANRFRKGQNNGVFIGVDALLSMTKSTIKVEVINSHLYFNCTYTKPPGNLDS